MKVLLLIVTTLLSPSALAQYTPWQLVYGAMDEQVFGQTFTGTLSYQVGVDPVEDIEREFSFSYRANEDFEQLFDFAIDVVEIQTTVVGEETYIDTREAGYRCRNSAEWFLGSNVGDALVVGVCTADTYAALGVFFAYRLRLIDGELTFTFEYPTPTRLFSTPAGYVEYGKLEFSHKIGPEGIIEHVHRIYAVDPTTLDVVGLLSEHIAQLIRQ